LSSSRKEEWTLSGDLLELSTSKTLWSLYYYYQEKLYISCSIINEVRKDRPIIGLSVLEFLLEEDIMKEEISKSM